MIYPAPDHLDSIGSKYALVIVVAKRARQIKEGARKLVDSRSGNPLTVALEEVATNQIVPLLVGDPEPLPTSISAGPVLTGLLSTSIDDDTPVGKFDSLLPLTDDLDDLDATADSDEEFASADEDALEEDLDGATVDEETFGLVSPVSALDGDVYVGDPDATELLLDDTETEEE